MTEPWVLFLGLGAAGAYVAVVRFWPYTSCWRCGGTGKLRSPSGKNWRRCPRCKGSGTRLRLGRHVLNAFRTAGRNGFR